MNLVPDLPVEDPVLIFAIAMLVFLSAPLLLHRHRLPGIVGILLVGAVISARHGTVGWQRTFESMPNRIADATRDNFRIVYPDSGEQTDDRRFLRFR